MKLFVFAVLIAGTQLCSAQSVTPFVIVSGGSTGKVNNIQFDFVIGELATTTIVNRDTLNQGFLQPYYTPSIPLPVTGLQFTAQRISNAQVQLNWKTVQEMNNKGFHIERRKESENSFSTVGFAPSLAAGGNSATPLSYLKTDDNNSTGKTLYRLKQQDIDGNSSYSLMQIVQGTDGKIFTANVWPIPSKGPVYMIASGIQDNERLQVYDMNGRKVKELMIRNNTQVTIDGLQPGTYVVKLVGNQDMFRKIIVQ
ncbi:MAG TPA: T9SS type A sorting domain-containing protein [Pseudobacter sp.]|nr:T9SS type A sorting domain-containing protein [Pseudobacter sp.]